MAVAKSKSRKEVVGLDILTCLLTLPFDLGLLIKSESVLSCRSCLGARDLGETIGRLLLLIYLRGIHPIVMTTSFLLASKRLRFFEVTSIEGAMTLHPPVVCLCIVLGINT